MQTAEASFDQCRLSVRWPPTVRPSQYTWAVSPHVGRYHLHSPSPFISITQPNIWYVFYHLCSTEGTVNQGNAGRGAPHTQYCSGCNDKHKWQRGFHSSDLMYCKQTDMLPPDQRYLHITVEIAGCTAGHVKYDKCSAVAEMGDHLATTDMGRKLGLCPFFGGSWVPI